MHLEKDLPSADIKKVIMRHICRVGHESMTRSGHNTSWENITKKFVDDVMNSCCNPYGQKAWFYTIDLAPTFTQAALWLIACDSVEVQ